MVLLRFNQSSNEWDIIDRENKQPGDLYLDGRLYQRLMFAKKQISKNHDAGGLVCGPEGSGKSSLAGNVMRFMSDDKFNPLSNIFAKLHTGTRCDLLTA